MTKKTIIKFEQVCDQSYEGIHRLTGFIKARAFIDLMNIAELTANPREAKSGAITNSIIDSIKISTSTFPFKTKGILLASATPPKELDRKRFELTFEDPSVEGILDGGHNAFAIASHVLSLITEDESQIRKLKLWEDLKKEWETNKQKILELHGRESGNTPEDMRSGELDFLIPIEILAPNGDDLEIIEKFKNEILDICAARNNNAQLKVDTKANQAGHFDEIRKILSPELEKEVIWKENTKGRIPVRNLIALSWIPLPFIDLPKGFTAINPQQIYSSKQKCMDKYIELMKHEDISKNKQGHYELNNPQVFSAFERLIELPKLYDFIYEHLPAAYNTAGGKFGRFDAVKLYDSNKIGKNYLSKRPRTPFFNKEVIYKSPDGFVDPFVYGLSALLELSDGCVVWKTNPTHFLQNNFSQIVANVYDMFSLTGYDPQKFGKSTSIYNVIRQQFEVLLKK